MDNTWFWGNTGLCSLWGRSRDAFFSYPFCRLLLTFSSLPSLSLLSLLWAAPQAPAKNLSGSLFAVGFDAEPWLQTHFGAFRAQQMRLWPWVSHVSSAIQGGHRSLKILENRKGPWKFWNLMEEGLERTSKRILLVYNHRYHDANILQSILNSRI